MPQMTQPQEIQIYQIKITLLYTRPPIWRRVEVPSHIYLADLHQIIQIVMEWTESHLWEVHDKNKTYSDPKYFDEFDDIEIVDSKKMKLFDVLKRAKSKIIYVYDFGDDWEHEVVLEKKFPPEIDVDYPRCTDGKLACPPEDCGGINGFYRMLECLSDPDDEEYESMKEWVGEGYNPEYFDIEGVNKALKKLKM